MKGRTPTVSEKRYMSAICHVGCIICQQEMSVYTQAAPHHTEGKTKPGAHYLTIALCGTHHQGGADCVEYTSRHPHKARFEKRYGTERELIQISLDSVAYALDDAARLFFEEHGFQVRKAA